MTTVNDSELILVLGATKLDFSTVRQMRKQLLSVVRHQNSVRLDLRNVEVIDSAGAGLLLQIHRVVASQHGVLRLHGVRAGVYQLLELLRLNHIFETHSVPVEPAALAIAA